VVKGEKKTEALRKNQPKKINKKYKEGFYCTKQSIETLE